MKRVELFEFEDFSWFPSRIRTSMTHLIVVFLKMIKTSEVIAKLLSDLRSKIDFSKIVDMGSGSGGAMPEVLKKLNDSSNDKINLTLTDLHPNKEFVSKFNKDKSDHVIYSERPLNATTLEYVPPGLKTMINSFHHMNPDMAKKILTSAKENKQSIFIYEIGVNNIPTVLWALFLPVSLTILIISVLFMTPFVRPMSWQQIVFTYLIPIIPIAYAWDGQASLMRMYSIKDVDELLIGLKDDSYEWTVDYGRKANGKKAGYFISGRPLKGDI